MPETNARIKVCHDTAANFKTNNPTLLVGEWALETDTKKMKIGDGVTAYNSLQYSTAEDSEEWQKPADWIDIRNGALTNSVYFLVAHSADFQTYPQFVFNATISNSGTYDVFVDGIKVVSAAANRDTTTLNWSTLYSGGTIAGGFEVIYPTSLITHVVRVTPSSSSNTISVFNTVITDGYDAPQMGVLWCHITVATALSFKFGSAYKAIHPLLEAITGVNNTVLCKDCTNLVRNCSGLKYIDTLDFSADTDPLTTNNFQGQFANCTKLKKLSIKNIKQNKTGGAWYTIPSSVFDNCNSLRKIEAENVILNVSGNMFYNNGVLKSIAGIQFGPSSGETATNIFKGCTSLESTYLDFSNYSAIKRLVLGGSSTAQLNGIKSLTISDSAPFDSATSPQLDVSYTGMNRVALVNLFKSMPYNVGYTVVGNPTIVDGVASGFSASNYLTTTYSFTYNSNTPFEFVCRFKTPTFEDDSQGTFVCLDSFGGRLFGLLLDRVNKRIAFRFAYLNSTAYTVRASSNYNYQQDTWYRAKATILNGVCKIQSFDDNGNLLQEAQDTFSFGDATYPVIFMCASTLSGSAWGNSGSVDLNNTYIKVNGVTWFRGTAAMTKTCSVVGCTGTADLTATDKAIATGKGWELTLS